ncbi:hypothetical protein HIM_07291 [Hirsutella minnesotensis 3608]|uniref:F-box domain-containing protein n=1 Tax=Hirsutella minnesotensis 3608 TaxID=1043627 RepID=A0A0F7ZYY6_9HYPO|nr:hypothetical protein HIM_07291 [Hirsutella minnesotensis 3608]
MHRIKKILGSLRRSDGRKRTKPRLPSAHLADRRDIWLGIDKNYGASHRSDNQRESDQACHPNQNSLLATLPVELLLCITDELDRPSQLVLSITCRDLRAVLKPRVVTFSQLDNLEKHQICTTIARITPIHFASAITHKMGRACLVNPRPTSVRQLPSDWCSLGWRICPMILANSKTRIAIGVDDCQLALKIMRLYGGLDGLSDSDDCRYALKIMKWYGQGVGPTEPQQRLRRFLNLPSTQVARFQGELFVNHQAQLRIVEKQLFMYNEWRITEAAETTCSGPGVHGHIYICPHQEYKHNAWFRPPEDVPGSGALGRAMSTLSLQQGASGTLRCDFCATDFEISGSSHGSRIRSWTFLGEEDEKVLPRWIRMFMDVNTSHHKQGEIRQRFESANGQTS